MSPLIFFLNSCLDFFTIDSIIDDFGGHLSPTRFFFKMNNIGRNLRIDMIDSIVFIDLGRFAKQSFKTYMNDRKTSEQFLSDCEK